MMRSSLSADRQAPTIKNIKYIRMKIALAGYGKMGKAIERIAIERGHEITLRTGRANQEELNRDKLSGTDVVIEFSSPEAAFGNVSRCLSAGVPVVCGTTGWNAQLAEAEALCLAHRSAFLQASNFSIGVNVFFALNGILARMMNAYPEYEVTLEETHHIHKKDAPSGTAISIAEKILANLDRKKKWTETQPNTPDELSIIAHRAGEVPGTHVVKYHSPIDDIELIHTAHNRDGFALGAVVAAEFLKGKQGIFKMSDVLGLKDC
ncbi:MAG TPA: 4-hydroxy-tetrahydrodipicolinate reductase [Chitinophagaceae bacterium]|nr:4-hydroxy-tetrahydrodipicolinate reductase [Chitinophagaceae bacterium]